MGYLHQQVRSALPLFASDLVCLLIAFVAAIKFCYLVGYQFLLPMPVLFGYLATGLVACCVMLRLYPACGSHPVEELRQCVTATSALAGVFLFAFLARNLGSPLKWVTLFAGIWCVSTVLIPLSRSLLRKLLAERQWWAQPVAVIGAGPQARKIYRYLLRHQQLGLRPVGLVEVGLASTEQDPIVVGEFAELRKLAIENNWFRGVVAIDDIPHDSCRGVLDACSELLPQLVLANPSGNMPTLLTTTQCLGGNTGLVVKERLLLPMPRIVKRTMDIVVVLLGSALLLPLFVLLSLAIKLSSAGPVFYRQRRVGAGGQRFWAWKFRSMVENADEVLATYLESNPEAKREWEMDHKLKRDPRITRVGWFLRKTSLDELPQLWNVIRGEMSLVGPRPIVDAEISKYDLTYQYYSRVKPGITGLWQISGRNNTTYEERIEFDSYYAKNWSPWLDIYILVRTIKVVLKCEGAY